MKKQSHYDNVIDITYRLILYKLSILGKKEESVETLTLANNSGLLVDFRQIKISQEHTN